MSHPLEFRELLNATFATNEIGLVSSAQQEINSLNHFMLGNQKVCFQQHILHSERIVGSIKCLNWAEIYCLQDNCCDRCYLWLTSDVRPLYSSLCRFWVTSISPPSAQAWDYQVLMVADPLTRLLEQVPHRLTPALKQILLYDRIVRSHMASHPLSLHTLPAGPWWIAPQGIAACCVWSGVTHLWHCIPRAALQEHPQRRGCRAGDVAGCLWEWHHGCVPSGNSYSPCRAVLQACRLIWQLSGMMKDTHPYTDSNEFEMITCYHDLTGAGIGTSVDGWCAGAATGGAPQSGVTPHQGTDPRLLQSKVFVKPRIIFTIHRLQL